MFKNRPSFRFALVASALIALAAITATATRGTQFAFIDSVQEFFGMASVTTPQSTIAPTRLRDVSKTADLFTPAMEPMFFATGLIAGWDFQTTTNGGTAAAAAPSTPTTFVANFGSGNLYLNGSNGASTWVTATSGNELTSFGGTAVNAGTGFSTVTSGASSLSILNSTANGKALVIRFSMTGKQDLAVSFAMQRTATGFTTHQWDYSTDGTNWTAAQTLTGLPSSYATQTLTTITGLNNAANAYLRLTVTGASAAAGNNRLDNIQLVATDIPTFFVSNTTVAFGNANVGSNSFEDLRSVTVQNLITDLVCSPATADFQVATSSGSFGPSVSFNGNGTLRTRFSPQTAGAKNDTVTCTTTGAASQSFAVSGTGVAALSPPVVFTSFLTSPINVGQTSLYQLSVSNPNVGTPLTGVSVSNTLPVGLSVQDVPTTALCSAGGTYNVTSNVVTFTNFTVNNGTPCTLGIQATANGAAIGVLTNTTGSVTSTNGGTGNTATANITVNGVLPTVTSVSPASGTALGGTAVTVNGTNLGGASSVTFGGSACVIGVITSTAITCTTPAHAAGAVNVAVTTPSGTGTGTNAYTYVALPPTTVVSLTTQNANPTNQNAVQWTIEFADAVDGVTASNFALVNGGLTGPSISGVGPQGSAPDTKWNITVNTGTGDGTLGLNFVNATGMTHTVSTTLPYVGQVYNVDKGIPAAPVITGSTPTSPSNNASPTINGTAEAGTTVNIYTSSDCTSGILNGAFADGGGNFAIVVTVPTNTTTNLYANSIDGANNVSPCSGVFAYTHTTVVPPTVAATNPADGATISTRNTPISVTFDQAMTPATITTQGVAGACSGSLQVSSDNFATCIGLSSPVASGGNTVFTATPVVLLNGSSIYKIRVTTAAQSAGSTPLAAQYTQTTGFTTGAAPNYEVTTTATSITVTDISGNNDTINITEPSAGNIRFAEGGAIRTFSVNGGAVIIGNSGNLSLSGITSITFNGQGGNDTTTVGAFSGTTFPNLTINGGQGDDRLDLNGNITFASNASFDGDMTNDDASPGFDDFAVITNADLVFSGTGAFTLKVSKNIQILGTGSADGIGSTIRTVNGNVSIEANQLGGGTGEFRGIYIDDSVIEATGTGTVTLRGRGGVGGTTSIGIGMRNFALVKGGTTGAATTLTGNGGSGGFNHGLEVGLDSTISSYGGNVSVTGTGGSGSGGTNLGFILFPTGIISTTGNGSIIVAGTGGTGGSGNDGIRIDGSLSKIAAAGSGTVTVTATGGVGDSPGLNLSRSGSVTAVSGTISITGTEGGNGTGIFLDSASSGNPIISTVNQPIELIANKMNFLAGSISANTGTVNLRPIFAIQTIDLGGLDSGAQLGLTDAELDRCAASGTLTLGDVGYGGAVRVSGAITQARTMNILQSATTTVLSGGDLGMFGTLTGPLTVSNGGILRPGSSPGVINSGSVTLNSTSVFNVELGGTTPGNIAGRHDQVNSSFFFVAGGTLNVSFISPFVPTSGDTFTIATSAGATSGTFATVNWPAGYSGTVTYNANNIVLSNIVALPPTVIATAATNVASTTATLNGEVTADGGSPVTARGFYYKQGAGASISDTQAAAGSGTGTFDANIGSLLPNTLYSYIAYATNGTGTSYSTEQQFTTTTPPCTPPSITYVDDNFVNPVLGEDPDLGGPATQFGCDSFATVQGGVDGVTAGGTVIVRAGNYPETVSIPKVLTLNGAQVGVDARGRAASESVITSTGPTGVILIGPAAGTVTIDGFDVSGTPTPFSGATIYVPGATTNVVVKNTIIQPSSADAIFINNAPAGTIERNWIKGAVLSGITGGINASSAAALIIQDNKIEGSLYGITGYLSNTSILNNEITGVSDAGAAGIAGQFHSTTIVGNVVSGYTGSVAMALQDYLARGMDNIDIRRNTFTGNGGGVYVNHDLTGLTITMNMNRIVGNPGGGVIYGPSGLGALNAQNNWWGCNAGPGNTGCDTVAAPGNFTPWMVLTVAASSPAILPAGSSTITADMTTNSAPAIPSGGPLPNIPLSLWSATNGTMNPTSGTVMAGTANSLFTSNTPVNGTACATVDNQQVCKHCGPAAADHYCFGGIASAGKSCVKFDHRNGQ